MAVKDKSITILGAGIGGLTAAVALARRGANVTVLDQTPELADVGAGIQITPNGSAVFEALGLGRRLHNISVPLEQVELRDYHSGKSILNLQMNDRRHSNNNPYLLVHRADLIDMLAASVKRHGVTLSLGKKITGVAIGFDQATLPVEDGPQRTTKILIGADGLRSLTRQSVTVARKPEFTGQVAWRTTIEARHVPIYDTVPTATIYAGPGRHLVTYPVRGGALINIVGVEARESWAAEGWNHRDDPENLRNAFSGFAPEVRRLLSLCDDVYLWGLFSHPVAESWHQSGVAILGDAAHPMLPHLAQGANMAVEDAWVLATEMDRHDDLQHAFAAYQKARKKRVARVVKASRGNTRIYQMRGGLQRAVVHGGMRLMGRFAPGRAASRFDWLYGVDVTR